MTTTRHQGADIVPLWTYQTKMNNAPLQQMKDYWSELRAGRLAPLRSEIDPRAIAASLENGFIVERTQPGSVRFRLAGMQLCDLMGMEVRGMPLTCFIQPADRTVFSAQVEQVFNGPEIHEYNLISDGSAAAPLSATLLLLPLKSDQGTIDRAMGCLTTQGMTGIAPRRFRVADTCVTDLRSNTVSQHANAQSETRVVGFAEPVAHFTPAPLNPPTFRADGRPNLRLIQSDE